MQLNNKHDLKTLRSAIERACQIEETLSGLTFHAGNIKFEADGSSCRVTLTVERNGAAPKEERDWKQYAEAWGLPPKMLGKSFTRRNGELVTVVGLCPSRSKFPVMVKSDKGKFLITFEETMMHKEVAE